MFLPLLIGCLFWNTSCSKQPAEIEIPAPSRPFLQTKAELCANYGHPAAIKAQKLRQAQGLAFQSGNMTIVAEFLGDECHYIRYAMPQPWSGEQIKKFLYQNGCRWIIPSPNGCGWTLLSNPNPPPPDQIVEYTSKEGNRAKYTGVTHWLEIWSAKASTTPARKSASTQIQKPATVKPFSFRQHFYRVDKIRRIKGLGQERVQQNLRHVQITVNNGIDAAARQHGCGYLPTESP